MNQEEIRLLHRSHDEGMVQGKLGIVDEIYGEDFVLNSQGVPDSMRHGPEAIRQQYEFLRSAFSDMQIDSDLEIVEGDLIGVHWTWKARHTGDFLGIPPTGAEVQIEGFDLIQIKGGKIRAAWVIQDGAGLMAQLQAAMKKA